MRPCRLITKAQNYLQQDLAKKQEKYQSICLENPLAVKARDGVHSFQERIRDVEGRQSKLEMRQKEIETRQKFIANGLKDGVSREVILATMRDPANGKSASEDAVKNLEIQLLEMKLRYEEMTQTLGIAHPQQALMRRIELVKEQLGRHKATEAGKATPMDPLDLIIQSLKAEYEENRLMLDSLAEPLKAERAKADELARYLIKEEEARGDVVRVRQLYDTTVDRLRQINLTREAGGFDARVITPAGPGGKVAPVAFTYGALAIFGGLAAGLALAYLSDMSDRSFRSPVEIKQRLGLPVIGHIPHLAIADSADPASCSGRPPQVIAYHLPRSPQSEAFRGVRTALYFSTRGSGHQVIQVTSPSMGDGKSTLTANLAVSIAQSRQADGADRRRLPPADGAQAVPWPQPRGRAGFR